MSPTAVTEAAAPPATVRRARTTRRGRLNPRSRDRVIAVLTPLVLLAAWELAARAGLIDARFFPPPSSVFERMVALMASGELWIHLGVSLRRLFLGFWLGLVPAIVLGVLMGLNRSIRAAISPLVSGTYPIPKSALLPLILLIFGLGEMSKIVMVAIGVFYPVVINTMSGVVQVSAMHYDVARNFGADRWQVFRTVAVPGAMPSIMTGVELGAGLGLILIAIAEMVGAQTGLGFMIWNAWQLYSVETMYVGLLVVALLGFGLSVLLRAVGRLLMPWQRS